MRKAYPPQSREKLIFVQLNRLAGVTSKGQVKERSNSARSRAHRLDIATLPDTAIQRVNAILHMADTYRAGWLKADNFINVVRDIVKE